MKIQNGIVEYKDRDDINCTYGITDDGRNYYFLGFQDYRNLMGEAIIASTELVEAIDPMYNAKNVGVIDSYGNVIIPFQHRSIRPIDENMVLAELANPITPSVIEANQMKSDPTLATKLVSTPALIKNKLNSAMGGEGKYIFNDQFSEATIYDKNGNNLINNQYYSFIAMNDNKLYFSKNTVDSEIVGYSLITAPVQSLDSSSINVQNVNVPIDTVENALVGGAIPEEVATVQGDNVNSSLASPGEIQTSVPENLGAMNENVEASSGQTEQSQISSPDQMTEEHMENSNIDELSSDLNSAMQSNESNENVEASSEQTEQSQISSPNQMTEEHMENSNIDELSSDLNSAMQSNESNENVEVSSEQTEQSQISSLDQMVEEHVENSNIDELSSDLNSAMQSNESNENVEVSSEQTEQNGISSLDQMVEEHMENSNIDELSNNELYEDTEENVELKEEEILIDSIPEEIPFSVTSDFSEEVFTDEDQFTEEEENNKELEKFDFDIDEIPETFNSSIELEDTELDDMVHHSLDDVHSDSLEDLEIDVDSLSEIRDYEHFLPNYSEREDSIISDVAKSMEGLVKQNRQLKSSLAATEENLRKVTASRRNIADKSNMLEKKIEALNEKAKALQNMNAKLESDMRTLRDKIREQKQIIDNQTHELDVIRPQLRGKENLVKILADAQILLGDEATSSYEDNYYRRGI